MPQREFDPSQKVVRPTPHALEKMALRDVKWGDVLDVIAKPEVSYGPDFQDRTVVQKGNLSVVVARDGAVITVLLRSEAQWTDDEARQR